MGAEKQVKLNKSTLRSLELLSPPSLSSLRHFFVRQGLLDSRPLDFLQAVLEGLKKEETETLDDRTRNSFREARRELIGSSILCEREGGLFVPVSRVTSVLRRLEQEVPTLFLSPLLSSYSFSTEGTDALVREALLHESREEL